MHGVGKGLLLTYSLAGGLTTAPDPSSFIAVGVAAAAVGSVGGAAL